MLTLGTPQLIYLSLLFIAVGHEAAMHGKPKSGNHSFWAAALGSGLALALQYWGGFYG